MLGHELERGVDRLARAAAVVEVLGAQLREPDVQRGELTARALRTRARQAVDAVLERAAASR